MTLPGVSIAPLPESTFQQILTPEALAFLVELERKFGPAALRCSRARRERQARLDAGEQPDFLQETAHVRDGDWTVAPLPQATCSTAASRSPGRSTARW